MTKVGFRTDNFSEEFQKLSYCEHIHLHAAVNEQAEQRVEERADSEADDELGDEVGEDGEDLGNDPGEDDQQREEDDVHHRSEEHNGYLLPRSQQCRLVVELHSVGQELKPGNHNTMFVFLNL